MRDQGFFNFYEYDSYCKNEGINTQYFINQVECCGKRKKRTGLAALLVALLNKLS